MALPLQIERTKNVIVCAGTGKSGKTTFALRYLLNADLAARFCFDPEGEYSQRLNLAAAGNPYDLAVALCQGWIVFDPHENFAGRIPEAFAWFCQWAFDMASQMPGQKILVVDEVWKYCSPNAIPAELALVCQTGSKRGLGLLVNTQLPNRLNGALLAEASEMVCFRLTWEKALAITEARGFNNVELANLAPLCFVARNLDSGGEARGRLEW